MQAVKAQGLEGLGEAQGQPVGEQRGNVISCPSSEPGKTCTVSFQDSGGVPHAVEVGAETLYEAAVLGLKAFREHDCAPGPAAHLDIDVKSPSVRHTVVARKVEEWLTGGARSPSEALEKRRLNCSAAEEKCLWG